MTAMNPNQALWEKGDFTRLAATMRKSGEDLVNQLGLTKDHFVLDLGCGDGTTAIPVARLGDEGIGRGYCPQPGRSRQPSRKEGRTFQYCFSAR